MSDVHIFKVLEPLEANKYEVLYQLIEQFRKVLLDRAYFFPAIAEDRTLVMTNIKEWNIAIEINLDSLKAEGRILHEVVPCKGKFQLALDNADGWKKLDEILASLIAWKIVAYA